MDVLKSHAISIKENFSWKWGLLAGVGLTVLLVRRRIGGKKCPSTALIPGKTVIITGANSGIGKATATELAKRKARVILACRDIVSAEATVRDIRRLTDQGELLVKPLDLASLSSIKTFCNNILEEEDHIDVLVNNAGIYQCPFMKTEDGFEMQMGVNHLGHFYLTNLLLDRLKKSTGSRIIIVSSGLHKLGHIDFDNLNSEMQYSAKHAYYNSKLANNLFARQLSKELKNTVSVYCVRPGMVRTNLGRHIQFPTLLKYMFWPLIWLLVKNPTEGCQTVVYCVVAKELDGVSNQYYSNCKVEPWTDVSVNDSVAERLWNTSAKLTKLA